MIAFLTIIYAGLIVLVYVIFKVKPRPWNVAAFITLGVLLVGGVMVVWTLAAPMSGKAVVSRYVVELVPWVKGQVISIPAQPNVPLKKGDVLYEIDPTPYQLTVNEAEAQLKAGVSNVAEAEAGAQAAAANIKKAEANLSLKKTSLDVANKVQELNPAAIAKLKLAEAQQDYAAAQAEFEQAQAAERQAQSTVAAAKNTVVSIQAQLDTAKFNLRECTVKAPADGFITDWQIRVGTYVVAMPMASAGTFIDTSVTSIVASFPAEQLIHVEPGQDVELAFKSAPGRLFRGKVDTVIQATGEGQFTPTGKLPSAASVGSPGFLAVKIHLDDREAADALAMGTPGAVAIYTDWGKPFAMISKVTIRMRKWLYFLPLPG